MQSCIPFCHGVPAGSTEEAKTASCPLHPGTIIVVSETVVSLRITILVVFMRVYMGTRVYLFTVYWEGNCLASVTGDPQLV